MSNIRCISYSKTIQIRDVGCWSSIIQLKKKKHYTIDLQEEPKPIISKSRPIHHPRCKLVTG
ncbi:hypothetical protein Hanom_Chr16g01477151 [Helianthus anomalus]